MALSPYRCRDVMARVSLIYCVCQLALCGLRLYGRGENESICRGRGEFVFEGEERRVLRAGGVGGER